MQPIQAVLFDADGVLQRPAVLWGPAFQHLFTPAELDRVVGEILAVEQTFLDRDGDVPAAISAVLASHRCAAGVEDVMAVFNGIHLNEEVLAVVAGLRRAAVRCYLASNQQSHRALHMSENLKYRSFFEKEFYSCRMGVAKPQRAFFEKILAEVDLPGDSVLFIDDREENVKSAEAAGINGVVFDEAEGLAVLLNHLSRFGLVPAPAASN